MDYTTLFPEKKEVKKGLEKPAISLYEVCQQVLVSACSSDAGGPQHGDPLDNGCTSGLKPRSPNTALRLLP